MAVCLMLVIFCEFCAAAKKE